MKILLAVAAFLAIALTGSASATSPPQAPAEIVFANGGRIVSIKADGTGRKVLTRKDGPVVAEHGWDAFVPVEDSDPSISPDGSKLLFRRDRDLAGLSWKSALMVANRDGGGPKQIAAWKNAAIDYLGWTPDGRIVAGFYNYGHRKGQDFISSRIISMDQQGGSRSLLLSRTSWQDDFNNYDQFLRSGITMSDISPDGKSLLYTAGGARQTSIRIINLETRADRKVVEGASEASFSPDGKQIVFTESVCRDRDGNLCKGRKAGIWKSNVDGSSQKRLVGGIGLPGGVEWSADGDTITFDSSRNFPSGSEEAREIYSVGVDGNCLSWLTNGSPESEGASWAPEALGSRPLECGDGGLKPLVEVAPLKAKETPRPRLWAGPNIRGRLLSATGVDRDYESYYYEDCAYFDRKKCRESLMLESIPVCNPGNMGNSVNIFYNRMVPSVSRGALLNTMLTRTGSVSAMLLTGNANISFGDSAFLDSGGIPTTVRDMRFVMAHLRPVGSKPDPGAELPAPRLGSSGESGINDVYRVYARTGSISETSKLLGFSRADVRWLIRWKPVMSSFMPFKVAKCSG